MIVLVSLVSSSFEATLNRSHKLVLLICDTMLMKARILFVLLVATQIQVIITVINNMIVIVSVGSPRREVRVG